MNMALNWDRWRIHLAELAARSRSLKRSLRAPWTEPMGPAQRELTLLKRRTTELCALRAWSRGKLHFRGRPPGHDHCEDPARCHQRIAERLGPAYAELEEARA